MDVITIFLFTLVALLFPLGVLKINSLMAVPEGEGPKYEYLLLSITAVLTPLPYIRFFYSESSCEPYVAKLLIAWGIIYLLISIYASRFIVREHARGFRY